MAIILSGLGYIQRGNEVAFTGYSRQLVQHKDLEIFIFGSGKNFHLEGAKYVRVPCLMRHWFTKFPRIKRLHLKHNHDYENMVFSIFLIPYLFKHKLDVILFSAFPFTLLPLWLYKTLRNRKVKIVFNPGGGSAFLYSRFFFTDVVTATDPASQRLYSRRFRTVCIPAGTDPDFFRPRKVSRAELGLPEDKFIIFSSSALAPVKRIDFLIKAASQIDNAYLLLSNTGVQEKYLKELGKKLMGENIKFLGIINKETLAKCYNVADVVCLPSKIEPFGLVLVEAMACQTPVVTNDTEIQKWIVDEGGSCVDVSDMETLIKALEKYKDKKIAQEVGIQGRKNIQERFTWDLAGGRYYQLFKEIAEL